MVTTIQLREEVRKELESLKGSGRDTYEEVIVDLIRQAEKCKRMEKKLLMEGYLEMSEESTKIQKEWSAVDLGWD